MTAFLNSSLFFGGALTIACYALGLILRKRYKLAVFNPTLIGTVCVIAILTLADIDYTVYQQSASMISWFLTPATVCLALPLYEKLPLLKKYWKAVGAGLLCGTLASLVLTLLLCKLLSATPQIYATLLPKSITSAIGMEVSVELGGVASITVACIIASGIFGSITCEAFFRLFHITSPLAKGIAIGTSSHAIGTARAAEIGQVEAAMSSLALVVCGLVTVVLAPVFYGFF